jgi:ATP-binding cassette subfamily B protein
MAAERAMRSHVLSGYRKYTEGLVTVPPGASRRRRLLDESAFLREYFWQYRRFMAVGLAALFVVDGLEVIPPLLLRHAVDRIVAGGPAQALLGLAAGYLAIAGAQAAGRYTWRMYVIRTSTLAARDLRNRFTGHLLGLPASFFDRRRIGDLMSLATSDVEAVRLMIGAGILLFADALFYFLVVPVVMFQLSPILTALALLPLPIIPWIVMRNDREIHVRFARLQECLARLSALAQETLAGIRVVKGLAGEAAALARFRALGEEYRKLALSLARVQTAFGPTLEFTMSLGLTGLLFVGGHLLIDEPAGGALTLGVFVAFQRYIQQMVWPMAAVGISLGYYRRSATSTRRLQQVLSEANDVADVAAPRLPAALAGTGRGARTPGRIEFRALRFAYPNAPAPVLRDISIDIQPGERLAFLGAVGAGKSALLSLLPRLYPVERGMLLIDGVDVNDWPVAELRRQVGYVSQDVFLFSDTVVENVAIGLGEWVERQHREVVIQQAAALAAVHDDVLGLVASYETPLGARGVNLSGGQKQRLTIARALAREPAILVLDDALSSVDVQTEERILTALRNRPHRNTEVIAAHRLSTIQDADRIAVLAEGRLVQLGTHQQLMRETGGLYVRFYDQQRLREDLERYLDADREVP